MLSVYTMLGQTDTVLAKHENFVIVKEVRGYWPITFLSKSVTFPLAQTLSGWLYGTTCDATRGS